MNNHLFVYGTLRVHKGIPRLLTGSVVLCLNFRVFGYRMYSCGPYPIAVPTPSGNFSILGDLVRVPESLWERLDEYEGVPTGEYKRIWDEKHAFWIYVQGENPPKKFFPIDAGIWPDSCLDFPERFV